MASWAQRTIREIDSSYKGLVKRLQRPNQLRTKEEVEVSARCIRGKAKPFQNGTVSQGWEEVRGKATENRYVAFVSNSRKWDFWGQ